MNCAKDRIDWIEKPSKETIKWALNRLKELNNSFQSGIPPKAIKPTKKNSKQKER